MLSGFDLIGRTLDDIDALASNFFPGSFLGSFVGGESVLGGSVGGSWGAGFEVGLGDDLSHFESASGAVGELRFVEGLDGGKSSGADFAVAV